MPGKKVTTDYTDNTDKKKGLGECGVRLDASMDSAAHNHSGVRPPHSTARLLACLLCCVLLAAVFGQGADGQLERVDRKVIHAELERALKEYDVPALGAAVVRSDGLVAVAVAGVRKRGSEVSVTIND